MGVFWWDLRLYSLQGMIFPKLCGLACIQPRAPVSAYPPPTQGRCGGGPLGVLGPGRTWSDLVGPTTARDWPLERLSNFAGVSCLSGRARHVRGSCRAECRAERAELNAVGKEGGGGGAVARCLEVR